MVEREVEPRIGVHVPMRIGIAELDKKLASCGITTAYAALSFIGASVTSGVLRSQDHTTDIIDTIAGMKDHLLVDHRIHARFEVTFTPAIPTLQKLMDAGRLHLISLMDHTPGQGQYRDVELYIARIAKERGMLSRLSINVPSINQRVRRLSGGQRQAISICRAVGSGAKLVVMDEPTAALGVQETANVEALIRRLREQSVSVILVSHNFDQVRRLSDQIWVMRAGKMAATVRASETSGNELVALVTGAA